MRMGRALSALIGAGLVGAVATGCAPADPEARYLDDIKSVVGDYEDGQAMLLIGTGTCTTLRQIPEGERWSQGVEYARNLLGGTGDPQRYLVVTIQGLCPDMMGVIPGDVPLQ